ncbi:MAG: YdeI/OmpD-associated family protein [Mycobacteriales bacterium]
MAAEVEQHQFATAGEWADWFAEHHGDLPGVWVVFGKKNSGITTPTYHEILDVALRFGWIDGLVRRTDDATYRQRFTPRTPTSLWSAINRRRAEEMIAAGEMAPAGIAAVDRAKATGRWDAAYAGPATAAVPADLAAALGAEPAARALFDRLDAQNRYAILHRISTVKRAETRARKIEQYVAMLAAGETIYPRRGTPPRTG